jgi:hypothetical protein
MIGMKICGALALGVLFAMVGCGKDEPGKGGGGGGGGGPSGKASEAEVSLMKIQKALKTAALETVAYPAGNAGPTPAATCCGAGKGKCEGNDPGWQDPVWQGLDFEMSDPHYFTYEYTSNGQTATVKAVGDLDCDGDTIEYVLDASIESGVPMFGLRTPTTSD